MFILNEGEYTGDIVYHTKVDDCVISHTHYSTKKNNPDWHYHENVHICFVFQGGKAETRHQTLYTQKNGSIFFYHAEEKHRWISPQPISKSANIELGYDFLKKYHLSEYAIKQAIEKNIDARAIMLKMQQEMLFGTTTALQALLLELVSYQEKPLKNDYPRWVIKLTELLHDQWNEPLTLAMMAQEVGVHPVTISKFFRKYFACTLGEYQRKLKVDQSIQLIKNSPLSLSEIAHYCGFA